MKISLITCCTLCAVLVAGPPGLREHAAFAAENAGAEPAETVARITDSITFDGQEMEYTTSAGTLLIRDGGGDPVAEIFYTAHVQNGADPETRPITFLWDGGPGGASTPMDFLGFGPLRYSSDGATHQGAPFRLQPNEHSLLRDSDLVFLDLIGTGYSRAVGKAQDSDFWGVDADADVSVRAIERFLKLNDRWQSPKFIIGNSYGTSRAAIVANRMQSRGISLNGVVLIASALNFGAYANGMDHQFIVNLPTLAATAWYHGKTAHQSKPLPAFLDEVRRFARGPYAEALFEGNALAADRRKEIAARLAGYIGLSPAYVDRAHLRVSVIRFRKELLRDEGLVVGRLDGRTTATDFDHAGEEPESDYGVIQDYVVPGSTLLHDVLERRLGYRRDADYVMVNGEAIQVWNWEHELPAIAGISKRDGEKERNIFPQNTWPAGVLGVAMRANPSLQVFQINAYYDFATPFGMADYDLARITFDEALRSNIRTKYYEAGHTVFTDDAALAEMSEDLGRFYEDATGQ